MRKLAAQFRLFAEKELTVRDAIMLAFVVVTMLTMFAGCTPYTKDDARADRDALVAALPEIEAEIAKLPEGDPVRKQWESKRATLLKALKVADAVIEEDPTQLQDAVKDIPYAGLALALGGLIWQGIKRHRERKALKQVVASVEAALPNKTPEQKLAMASVQDEATKKIVHALKPDAVFPAAIVTVTK